jgi:hypothetical protein
VTKTRIGSIAVVVAIGVGGINWVFAQGPREEDRPAMIVRNGSIIFEIQNNDGSASTLKWDFADGIAFKTSQQNGKRVISADATVTNGSGQCDLKGGKRFTLTYKEGNDSEDIHLIAAGQEPKIFPNDVLTRSTSGMQLTRGADGSGVISVRMDNQKGQCTLGKTGQIKFKFNH